MRDDWVRDRLAQLEPPPRRRGFEEELWERVEERQRAVARRWRLASVALAAVALVAVASAAVVAATRGSGSVVDRTVSCATEEQGGIGVLDIFATTNSPGLDYAVAVVKTGGATNLLVIDTRFRGYSLNGTSCRATKAKVPLARSKLPVAGASGLRCLLGGRVLLRFRLRLDKEGKPRDALIATRFQRKNRPLSFVRWSPKAAVGYMSSRCG